MTRTHHFKSAMLAALTGITLIGCEIGNPTAANASQKTELAQEHKAVIDEAKQTFNNRDLDASENRANVEMMVPDFTKLVEDVGATVVNIQIKRDYEQNIVDFGQFGGLDRLFEDFFNFNPFANPFESEPPSSPGRAPRKSIRQVAAAGSGFIIGPDGYIMTNAHVVKNASEIKVLLKDKREFDAEIVGLDEPSDIALIKIDAKNLPAIVTGDASKLKPGQWVAAIGAPFGFDNSVTSGIISATRRALPNISYTSFIQTDVAINPGNSGGPLFDLNGRVIGVNSQIFSKSGGFMGISFAVPIDVAMHVATQLKNTGTVERSKIGIVVQDVNQDLAETFGMDKPKGALVVDISPEVRDSNPDINVGDIIIEANGNTIMQSSDLPWIVSNLKPDTTVNLKVLRDKKEKNIKVRLSKLTNEEAMTPPSKVKKPDTANNGRTFFDLDKLGVTVAPLSNLRSKTALINSYGIDLKKIKGIDGLVITNVNQKGRMLGFTRGTIIVKIGTTNVKDRASAEKALKQHEDKIPLYILYKNQFTYVVISTK